MSWFTKHVRDPIENVGAIATAPFTFGQSKRLVSKSGQESGLGRFTSQYSDIARDVDIAGLVAGGAYLASPLAAPEIVGGTAPEAGAAIPAAAAAEVPTTSGALAQGMLEGSEAVAPAASAAEAVAPSAAPAVDSSVGMTLTPGPGGAGALEPAGGGGITGFVKANPILSLIGANMAGSAVSGYANRQAQVEAAQKKKEAELELADLPRKTKTGNPSVGGGGVNLNMQPGSKVLLRPDGTPVYRPGTGIINQAVLGSRG